MDPENPQETYCAICTSLTVRYRRLCLFLAIAILVVGLTFPLMHIMVLWTCGQTAANIRKGQTCADAEALSFGRGIIVPSTLVIGEVAAAITIGVWCVRHVYR